MLFKNKVRGRGNKFVKHQVKPSQGFPCYQTCEMVFLTTLSEEPCGSFLLVWGTRRSPQLCSPPFKGNLLGHLPHPPLSLAEPTRHTLYSSSSF